MAAQRALQEAGETVTASAPMSGPYALSAFGDAIFQGQVGGGSTENLTMLLTGYQKVYGDIYSDPTDAFEARALQHEIDHCAGLLFLDRVAGAHAIYQRKTYL